MRSPIRWALTLAVAVAVGVQLIPLEFPPDNPPSPGLIDEPEPVAGILRRACFDCHSNETHWPWYAHVAPVSWIVTADVAGGRSRMNLSQWKTLRAGFQRRFSRKIVERIEKGEMPMPRYLWLHPGARVRPEELDALRTWRDALNGEGG